MTNDMYHYSECGLDDVYLANGFRWHDTPEGSGVAIDDVEGLHRGIATALIHRRGRLNGKELRFLRTELELSQAGLARLLGMTRLAVSRWERQENRMSGAADRMIRVLYQESASQNIHIMELLETLADIDEMSFELHMVHDKEWKASLAVAA